MDRQEAIALIKELTTNGLIEASWVSIGERKPNDYQLEIKGNVTSAALQDVINKRSLIMAEKIGSGILVIHEP